LTSALLFQKMESKRVFLGLDVGLARTGIAYGDSIGRIAQPIGVVLVSDDIAGDLAKWVSELGVTDLVIGRPRNQSGETTKQTAEVEKFAKEYLQSLDLPIHWQDESVTSVIAEERLKSRKKGYRQSDIDAEAAAIILQDYLEVLA
jgi:putative holliday junction resolvase